MNGAVSFLVPGRAQPGGSKRGFPFKRKGGGLGVRVTDANPNVAAWRDRVAYAGSMAYGAPLLDCALALRLTIYLVRPRGHFGSKGLNAKGRATPFPISKPDTTKLVRALEDALTGIIWTDDARIVDQHAKKRWGERDEVLVEVAPMLTLAESVTPLGVPETDAMLF